MNAGRKFAVGALMKINVKYPLFAETELATKEKKHVALVLRTAEHVR